MAAVPMLTWAPRRVVTVAGFRDSARSDSGVFAS